MSLTGNLEDLPLLDILQIVSFSKKTGFLAIEAEIGHGAIVFDEGFVVAAFTWETPPLDPRARALAPEKRDVILRGRIEMALEQLIRMREGLFNFSLTDHVPFDVADRDIEFEMLSQGINAQELLLDLARGMDEDRRDSTAAVEASFAAAETDMDAGLAELLAPEHLQPPPLPRSAAPPPTPPHLTPPPLPPAHAAAGSPGRGPPRRSHAHPSVEGRALRDPAVEAPVAPAAGQGAPAAESFRTILLVDDEPDVRQVLGEHFARAGYTVVEAEDPDGAVKKGMRLAKAGTAFLLHRRPRDADHRRHVVPRRVRGGAEAGQGRRQAPGPAHDREPDHAHPDPGQGAGNQELRLQARPVEARPGAVRGGPQGLCGEGRGRRPAAPGAAGRRAARGSGPVAPPASPSRPPRRRSRWPPPAPAKPRPRPPATAPPGAPVHVAATADELSRELAMLGQRLDELRRPQDPTQIAALVMGVAKEFFERSVLFLVKNDELRGVNGFGPTARGDALNLLARELVIPLTERSIFSDVANARRGFTGPLPVSALDHRPAGQHRPPQRRRRGAASAGHPPRDDRGPLRRQPGERAASRAPRRPAAVHQPGRHRPRERHPPPQGSRPHGTGVGSGLMNPDDPAKKSQEFFGMFLKAKEFTEELLKENERLRFKIAHLEAEGGGAPGAADDATVKDLTRRIHELEERLSHTEERYKKVEEENKEFADRYIEIEEQNNNLANLYVASYQLHSTLDYREVVRIVQEIVINLIGAEAFHLFMVSEKTGRLELEISEGQAAPDHRHRRSGRASSGRRPRPARTTSRSRSPTASPPPSTSRSRSSRSRSRTR